MNILKEKINNLPQLPNNILELQHFKNLDSTDVEKLIKIINKDPFIVTNILKIANSGIFCFRSEITTLKKAINLLGTNFTISIAIGYMLKKILPVTLDIYKTNNKEFLYNSISRTNFINLWLSEEKYESLKNELILPAFLQEIGKYIISDIVEEKNLKENFINDLTKTNNIEYCERKYASCTTPFATATIFKHWNFANSIIIPIAFVENLEKCPKNYLKHCKILKVAKTLCNSNNTLNESSINKTLELAKKFNFNITKIKKAIFNLKSNTQI